MLNSSGFTTQSVIEGLVVERAIFTGAHPGGTAKRWLLVTYCIYAGIFCIQHLTSEWLEAQVFETS
jgi:hypothetical protein